MSPLLTKNLDQSIMKMGGFMKGKAKKLNILEKRVEIILIRGYNNIGINEILKARTIPKGSFYSYFKIKKYPNLS